MGNSNTHLMQPTYNFSASITRKRQEYDSDESSSPSLMTSNKQEVVVENVDGKHLIGLFADYDQRMAFYAETVRQLKNMCGADVSEIHMRSTIITTTYHHKPSEERQDIMVEQRSSKKRKVALEHENDSPQTSSSFDSQQKIKKSKIEDDALPQDHLELALAEVVDGRPTTVNKLRSTANNNVIKSTKESTNSEKKSTVKEPETKTMSHDEEKQVTGSPLSFLKSLFTFGNDEKQTKTPPPKVKKRKMAQKKISSHLSTGVDKRLTPPPTPPRSEKETHLEPKEKSNKQETNEKKKQQPSNNKAMEVKKPIHKSKKKEEVEEEEEADRRNSLLMFIENHLTAPLASVFTTSASNEPSKEAAARENVMTQQNPSPAEWYKNYCSKHHLFFREYYLRRPKEIHEPERLVITHTNIHQQSYE